MSRVSALTAHTDLSGRRARAVGTVVLFGSMAVVALGVTPIGASPEEGPPVDRAAAFGKQRTLSCPDGGAPTGRYACGGVARLEAARSLQGTDDRGFDVAHYDLAIDIGDTTISGQVVVQGRATMGGLSGIRLDLHDSYAVPVVESTTHTVTGTSRADNFLTIELQDPLPVDESFEVSVSWNGRPPDVGGPFAHPSFNWESHGSGADAGPVIYTLSVPYRSGTWWACKEDLTDKATIDIHATVPDTLVVAANGTLQSIDPAGPGRHTYHWSHASEIAAYLVVIHASNYARFQDTATIILDPDTGDSTTVDLEYFVYPERLTQATTDFQRMPVAMRFLSDLFGPYPFHAEKYAMAMVNGSFGMEHQTCVSIGNSFIRGVDPDSSLSAEWAFVHELSHHWWGDWITVADWRDVWLNEGFATYTEALWREYVVGELRGEGSTAGFDAYLAYMDRLDVWFPSSQTGFLSAIYDPTPLYGGAPYNKGAWVLHMLRYVVGDEVFFDILPAYAAARGDGNATTDDFVQIAETVSGRSLQQFFDQWIYPEGRPLYEVGWTEGTLGAGHAVTVQVTQTQSHAPYWMPLEIDIVTADSTYTMMVEVGDRSETFEFEVNGEPLEVTLDPRHRVLRNKPVPTSPLATTGILPPTPNPMRVTTTISYILGTDSDVTLRVYDVAGRSVRTLVDERQPPRAHDIVWDGRDDGGKLVGSGVYFVDLRTDDGRDQSRLVVSR